MLQRSSSDAKWQSSHPCESVTLPRAANLHDSRMPRGSNMLMSSQGWGVLGRQTGDLLHIWLLHFLKGCQKRQTAAPVQLTRGDEESRDAVWMHLKKRASVWYTLSREEAEHSVATLTARAWSAFKEDLDLKTQNAVQGGSQPFHGKRKYLHPQIGACRKCTEAKMKNSPRFWFTHVHKRVSKQPSESHKRIFCGGSQSDTSLISICFSSGVAAAHSPSSMANFHRGLTSLAWWTRVNIKQISLNCPKNRSILCITCSHLNSCPENFSSASFILSSAWFSQNKLRLRDA